MFQRVLGAVALAVCLVSGAASAGTLVNLAHQAPEGIDIAFQLTDGRVFGQSFNEQHWYILTPDNKGSYQNGTWTQAASLPSNYAPYAFASQVLADGRVLVEGGEYNFGNFALTALGAIYDPKTNKWADVKPPKGLKNIGDSSSVVMPDGRFVFAEKLNKKLFALDPSTMHGGRIEREQFLVELLGEDEAAIGHHHGRGVADVLEALGRFHVRPFVRLGIVDRAQRGQREVTEIVLAALDQHASVGQHLRSEGVGSIVGGQARGLRPGAVLIAALVVGREDVPMLLVERLAEHPAVRQLKGDVDAFRRLVGEIDQRSRRSGTRNQTHSERDSAQDALKHSILPWPETAVRRWRGTLAGRPAR